MTVTSNTQIETSDLSKFDGSDLNTSGRPIETNDILNCLRERYNNDLIYTAIGPTCLISINPCKNVNDLYSESICNIYSQALEKGYNKPPHLFGIAANAFYDMVSTGRDQTILCLGESGSGKTEATKLITRQYMNMGNLASSSGISNPRMRKKVIRSGLILEAFGCCQTYLNPNASRFGRYSELQFDASGTFLGCQVTDYLLEKTRVTSMSKGERNFHIFYALLAGATEEERKQWKLPDNRHTTNAFKYLSMSQIDPDDSDFFKDLKKAMKSLGLNSKYQKQIFQTLVLILHCGNLEFLDGKNKDQDSATIVNGDLLEFIAGLMGLELDALESLFTTKSKIIHQELCSVYLNADQARLAVSSLCRAIYSLLFTWLIEYINSRCAVEDHENTIGILDFPGHEILPINRFDQLMINYMDTALNEFYIRNVFENEIQDYISENVNMSGGASFKSFKYGSDPACYDFFAKPNTGLLAILDDETIRMKSKGKDSHFMENLMHHHYGQSKVFSVESGLRKTFTVSHYFGDVTYDITKFVERNRDHLSADIVTVMRGTGDTPGSGNSFLAGLFTSPKALAITPHPQDKSAIMEVNQLKKPARPPSVLMKKKKAPVAKNKPDEDHSVIKHVNSAFNELLEGIEGTHSWFILFMKPNPKLKPESFDFETVGRQVSNLGVKEIVQLRKAGYLYHFAFDDFVHDFATVFQTMGIKDSNSSKKILALFKNLGLKQNESFAMGKHKLFLKQSGWSKVMDAYMMEKEKSGLTSFTPAGIYYKDDRFSDEGSDHSATTEFTIASKNMFRNASDIETGGLPDPKKRKGSKGGKQSSKAESKPDVKVSKQRRRWLSFTKFCTWWIPESFIRFLGMRNPDIIQAWKEKVALCCIIFFLSSFMFAFILGLTEVLCPSQYVLNSQEVSEGGTNYHYVTARGTVFLLAAIQSLHGLQSEASKIIETEYKGKDATELFPTVLCFGSTSQSALVSFATPSNSSSNSTTDPVPPVDNSGAQNYHSQSAVSASFAKTSDVFAAYLGFTLEEIQKRRGGSDKWVYVKLKDTNWILNLSRLETVSSLPDSLKGAVSESSTKIGAGQDATAIFQKRLGSNYDKYVECMTRSFAVGQVDNRNSPPCVAATILLIGSTALVAGVMAFKFLAALQFGARRFPEDLDKFVILQVPCYTESEASLRKTIDSLTVLKYDDKRKLLFIVADGMIVGSGNDRPTPRIVLDILGVDPSIDPPAQSFISIGEGSKQHNMGKVYSGLYECAGHRVPFIVVVKVGRPSERSRPGNRGKRDSQMILMKFLNKVYYGTPMTPLELDIYYHIQYVIGVDPSYYEYILMVDADTEVLPDSLNRLISVMIHDSNIMGLCGETAIANEKDSWVTMIQIYEYYISHHLAKAFESLFGSVTCLPGCFCMYRIKTPVKQKPLLIAEDIIKEYSDNNVDTLHKKNLLSLGEDRYLTTLMLKNFPDFRTKFTGDAKCLTVVPDQFRVLRSQRRRWINSTIHNLFELMVLDGLCGCCLFSMRFVVLLDLFATLTMPASFVYIGILVWQSVRTMTAPIISLYLLAATYGMQAVIFIMKMEFQHLGWMIISFLAMPIFSFYIPLYSFWHFDDFSWGNTRLVLGDNGRFVHAGDNEEFDPATVPTLTWQEYENQMRNGESGGTAAAATLPSPKQNSSTRSVSTLDMKLVQQQQPRMQQSVRNRSPRKETFNRRTSTGASIGNLNATAKSDGPTDEELIFQIKNILSTANLSVVTKKSIREKLSVMFQTDLTPRKEFINDVIEMVLQGRL